MLEEFGLMMKITQDNKTDMQEEMKAWGRESLQDGRFYFRENLGLDWLDDTASVWLYWPAPRHTASVSLEPPA